AIWLSMSTRPAPAAVANGDGVHRFGAGGASPIPPADPPTGFDRSIDNSLADAPKNPCPGRLMGQGPEGSGGARKNSNASRLTRRGFGRRGSSCCGAILAKRREAVQALGSLGPRSMSLYSRFIAILSVSRFP